MKNEIEVRYEKAVEQAREAIEELRLAALAKGYEEAKRDLQAVAPVGKFTPITAQEHRDEIIEMAKGDVDAIIERGQDATAHGDTSEGNETYRHNFYVAEFLVNREKRTVVALIRYQNGSRVIHRGIAKCDPSDCFNVHIGKAIALRRALGLEVPAEYFNAPQPTEVRVGDKIYLTFNGRIETVSGFNHGGYALTHETPGCVEKDEYKIIDDSRE